MYEIFLEGNLIALTGNPIWVKKHPTLNSYVPASQTDATGVSVQSLSQVFALAGRELDGLEHVVVQPSDGGAQIDKINTDVGFVAEMTDIGVFNSMNEKEKAIAHTHRWLRKQLRQGMMWEDDNLYNVTLGKQNLLQSQLLMANLQMMNGVAPEDVVLRWNAKGRAHEPWAFPKLVALAVAIHAHVEPMVVKQQEAEEQIIKAVTSEEIQKILEGFEI